MTCPHRPNYAAIMVVIIACVLAVAAIDCSSKRARSKLHAEVSVETHEPEVPFLGAMEVYLARHPLGDAVVASLDDYLAKHD